MQTFLGDLRYAFRMMLKYPGFTAIAVVTLALGIGANTAIFTVMDAVLLRPLPYPDSQQLVRLNETFGTRNAYGGYPGIGSISLPNIKDWQEQNQALESITAYQVTSRSVQAGTIPERIPAVEAAPNLFATLEVQPMMGRAFAGNEDKTGEAVAVISEALWRTKFHADEDIIGKTIPLDGLPTTVIGVMPKTFRFPPRMGNASVVFVPFHPQKQWLENRGEHMVSAIARIKPGISIDAAQADMNSVTARLEKLYRDDAGRGAQLTPLHEDLAGGLRSTLWVLFGAVGMVLLIACTNVANLLLARAIVRKKEISIRMALGAGPGRIIRQVLTESVLLALLASVAGAVIATWGVDLLVRLAGNQIPAASTVGYDPTVFGFLLLISVMTGIIFGVVPALHATRADVQDGLRESGTRAIGSTSHTQLRSGLVLAQVAMATVLLVAAGLLIQTFVRIQNNSTGLDSSKVLTFDVQIPADRYSLDTVASNFQGPLLDRVRSIPGVDSAALISHLPLATWGANGNIGVVGRTGPQGDLYDPNAPAAEFRAVSTRYFQTMGIPVLHGRELQDADNANAPQVVIINNALAKGVFPKEDPIGHQLKIDPDLPPFTIIGVVGDVRQAGLDRDALPELYVSNQQVKENFLLYAPSIVIRSSQPPTALAGPVRNALKQVDPYIAVHNFRSMETVISESLTSRRLNFILLTVFAGIALSLAAAGIYGVISYIVGQRTHEFAVRMALGAHPGKLLRHVLLGQLKLVATGVALGLTGAIALSRVLASFLYQVQPTDVATFASVVLLLLAVGMLASYIPALRATRVDPMVALRYE